MNTPLNHRLAAGSLLAQALESQAHVQLRRGDPALEAACLTRHAKVLIRTRSSVLCPHESALKRSESAGGPRSTFRLTPPRCQNTA